MLLEIAIGEGVEIRYNSKVVGVDGNNMTLTLEDGTKMTAPMVTSSSFIRWIVKLIMFCV